MSTSQKKNKKDPAALVRELHAMNERFIKKTDRLVAAADKGMARVGKRLGQTNKDVDALETEAVRNLDHIILEYLADEPAQ